ncbi:MAG: hydroxyisourate hydrolase [Alphaproteobacteria bacterium]
MSGLSTHVLDQTIGKPGAGVKVQAYRDGALITTAVTNEDGRCTELHGQGALAPGRYRLVFAIGAYFAKSGVSTPFFDDVAIDFTIPAGMTRCHVPLLASPFAYSTYRGS